MSNLIEETTPVGKIEGATSVSTLVVPRQFRPNLAYREAIRLWALKSKANRDWLMERCKNDFFFFLESFCWIFEPRPEPGRPQVIPFIPWDHQRPIIVTILEHLGYRDIGLEKARGEGASWICLMIILWRWLFHDMQTFGLVSRNELSADNPDDPDSLGWKIDWQLSMLPLWMVGKKGTDYVRNVSKHTWINRRTGSAITAYPATGDLASGGRKTAFFMDELSKFPRGPDEEAMAATEPVTNCRLLVSTPAGAEGAYYRCMTEASSMVKLILDWTKNPTRNKDLFRVDSQNRRLISVATGEDLRPSIVKRFFEQDAPILVKRGFDISVKNKLWSPWYVERCMRPRMTPKKIAQEYDRDYGGSSSRFFSGALIEMLVERCQNPEIQGDILIDQEKHKVIGFTKQKEGRTKLWCKLSQKKTPPPGDYVAGVDICTGQGGSMSSCSTICVADRKTGKKVMEYADPNIKPEQLASLAVAICEWFRSPANGSAFMIWECNGPGGAFRDFIIGETTFRNFYYRRPHKAPNAKTTKEPGWWSGKEQKRDMLSRYRFALTEGHFENLSEYALRECLCYIEDTGGKVKFVSGLNDDIDPANDGENHGDRVIADALASYAMHELNGTLDPTKHDKAIGSVGPPEGSFGYRRKLWEAHQKRVTNKDW
jgi:hypothetical protein